MMSHIRKIWSEAVKSLRFGPIRSQELAAAGGVYFAEGYGGTGMSADFSGLAANADGGPLMAADTEPPPSDEEIWMAIMKHCVCC